MNATASYSDIIQHNKIWADMAVNNKQFVEKLPTDVTIDNNDGVQETITAKTQHLTQISQYF